MLKPAKNSDYNIFFAYINNYIVLIFLLILINNSISNDNEHYEYSFHVNGLFYISLGLILYTSFVVKEFRNFLWENILIIIILIYGVSLGYFYGNDLYYIKEDFFNIAGLFVGASIYYLSSRLENLSLIFVIYLITIIILNMGLLFKVDEVFFFQRFISYAYYEIFFIFYGLLFIFSYKYRALSLIAPFLLVYDILFVGSRGTILMLLLLIISKWTISMKKYKFILTGFVLTVLCTVLVLGLSIIYGKSFSDFYRINESLHLVPNLSWLGSGLGSRTRYFGHEISFVHIGIVSYIWKFGIILTTLLSLSFYKFILRMDPFRIYSACVILVTIFIFNNGFLFPVNVGLGLIWANFYKSTYPRIQLS